MREQAMQAKRPIPECWRSIAERSLRATPGNETRFYSGMSVDAIRPLHSKPSATSREQIAMRDAVLVVDDSQLSSSGGEPRGEAVWKVRSEYTILRGFQVVRCALKMDNLRFAVK